MVKDMSATLDWFLDLTRTHGWKSFKFSFGPFMNQLVCTHPDTVKIVLKSGERQKQQDDNKKEKVAFSLLLVFLHEESLGTSSLVPRPHPPGDEATPSWG